MEGKGKGGKKRVGKGWDREGSGARGWGERSQNPRKSVGETCQTHDDGIYRASIASRGKNSPAAYSNKMINDKKY